MTDSLWLVLPGVFLWAGILALPWQPWRNRETLEAGDARDADLSDVTVLIPARNEAAVIAETLRAVAAQGHGQGIGQGNSMGHGQGIARGNSRGIGAGRDLNIVLVNDRSTDATVAESTRLGLDHLNIVNGRSLPAGWSGKLWALHQGLPFVKTELMLLLDADIRLEPGTLCALKAKIQEHDRHFVSILASLRMESFWEKLLMPAFVYFFKLLYPFHLSNAGSKWVAAAAGGCVLLRTSALARAGGFEAIKGKLIDDCALARSFRDAGLRTWMGLSHSVRSGRSYGGLADIRAMIARTAYTQLRHSLLLLALCTALLTSAFLLPVAGFLFGADPVIRLLGLAGLVCMALSYLPTLRYYGMNPAWCAAFPLAGALYLLMTWDSARRHWTGAGAHWKQRSYAGSSGGA